MRVTATCGSKMARVRPNAPAPAPISAHDATSRGINCRTLAAGAMAREITSAGVWYVESPMVGAFCACKAARSASCRCWAGVILYPDCWTSAVKADRSLPMVVTYGRAHVSRETFCAMRHLGMFSMFHVKQKLCLGFSPQYCVMPVSNEHGGACLAKVSSASADPPRMQSR